MYTYTCKYICMHIFIHSYMYTNLGHADTPTYIYMYIHTYTHICTHTYICISINILKCIWCIDLSHASYLSHADILIYSHIHTYFYICIYAHICIHTFTSIYEYDNIYIYIPEACRCTHSRYQHSIILAANFWPAKNKNSSKTQNRQPHQNSKGVLCKKERIYMYIYIRSCGKFREYICSFNCTCTVSIYVPSKTMCIHVYS